MEWRRTQEEGNPTRSIEINADKTSEEKRSEDTRCSIKDQTINEGNRILTFESSFEGKQQ
jgi:hypothetical protein